MADNPIFAINDRVRRLRASGADIVALTAGEPKDPTASRIVQAAQTALADPATHRYGPAAGEQPLRALVATQLPGGPWAAEDVVVTAGAKHALYLSLRAIIGAGDEVLVVEPGWPGHAAAVRAAGGVPVTVRTDDDLQLSVSAVRAVASSRTRAVIIASPANPTGTTLPSHLLAEIADWADQTGSWIISDDVYAAFDYSSTYAHLAEVAPATRSRLIIIDSVSKKHAMTGWRIGWLAGPRSVVTAAAQHLAATMTNVPTALQVAAHTALQDTAAVAAAQETYRRRRDLLVAALNQIPGVDCPTPDGGMFVFPSVRTILDRNDFSGTDAIAGRLLDAGVAVVPGEAFGAPDRLRICYAVDANTLQIAISRLRAGFETLTEDGATP